MCEISVIIPVYNTEKYLKKCINSILNQTFKNFEVILVDDGSKDGSSDICDDYAKKFGNIFVLHNINQGPAASRKCGVENANSDLIMFIDSDDWIEPNTLEVMFNELKTSEADIVTCLCADVYNNGKRVEHRSFQKEIIECNSFAECVYALHGTRVMNAAPWSKLYKKNLFYNIDFREHITIGEDYTMLLQLLHNASRVRMLNQILYNRMIHGRNISRSGYTQRHKAALDNYLMIRASLIRSFPEYEIEILGYHIEYEMAVITAMCRNKNFDNEVIQKLRTDLASNMKELLFQCKIPIYMKICAMMIAYIPKLFCTCFILIHKYTGR